MKHCLLVYCDAKYLAGRKARMGGPSDPIASKTALGWVLYGRQGPLIVESSLNNEEMFEEIEPKNYDRVMCDIMQKYLSLESFGISKGGEPRILGEDAFVKKIIDETFVFKDNHYEAGLLFKRECTIPESMSIAMARSRLVSSERSLRQKGLLDWTNKRIRELIELGYVRPANDTDLTTQWKRVWYLPTFVVVNQNKVPPKNRLVFDGAAEVKGKSLNSYLSAGPDLLIPLISALFRFRERKVAVQGDVRDMFHRVKIRLEDQQCQRFLWRFGDTSKEPTIFVCSSMTFGLTSSPTTAQLVKNMHALKYIDTKPEAVDALIKGTYVDDYTNSHDSIQEAITITNDAINIMAKISFDLVGFQSNTLEVLKKIPATNVKPSIVSMEPENLNGYVTKIFGLTWIPNVDKFAFLLTPDSPAERELKQLLLAPTKRKLLTATMKVFDPLGLILHYMIHGRISLQRCWREGVG